MPHKRERKRLDSLKIDKDEIANRIHNFHKDDQQDRSTDMEARLQRYAKFRGWTEGRDWIGDETSDVSLPDMMIHSLKMQDTLHNAVMSQRPAIGSKSIKKDDKDKQEKIDSLLDFQFFVEQPGEKTLEEITEAFVNDGVYTLFIPWIKEKKKVTEVRIHPPIPPDVEIEIYFVSILEIEFKDVQFKTKNGWDYRSDNLEVSFYTKDDQRVEMVTKKSTVVFDGPKPIVKDYSDVLYPASAANLQAPGPSNPNGAAHVLLLDYPTIDEIKKLKKSGFYDLVTKEDIEKIEVAVMDESYQDDKKQKNDFQGKTKNKSSEKSHESLTRITCFDMYDIDGDGLNEDVIWWMILETKTLLKAKHMTEMYPANPPRRPLAEGTFLPVSGRRDGISMLEMIEGVHDFNKQNLDMMMDAGTLANAPFFFYRPSSSVKQEVMRLWAGEGYPLSDPQNDVVFPNIGNQSQSFGINMYTLGEQLTEKLTVQGEINFGRVPQGKSSALRTAKGAQSIISQSESRPERILRRFFSGLAEAFAQMHELNKFFLPENKKFRIMGYDVDNDPYQEITDRSEIEGRFQFTFSANILNTSKAALQEGLSQLLGLYLNPLPMQMGLVTPENAYRLLRDAGKSFGQDPENKYITPPTETANKPMILAEEALTMIMDGVMPSGEPEEGAQQHLQKLQQFIHEEQQRAQTIDEEGQEGGYLEPNEMQILEQWFANISQRAQEEQKQQQLLQAAQQFQAPQGQGQGGQLPGNPQISENESLREDLQ